MLGIYLHIPYCRKICPYCDFNTYAVKAIPEEQYRDGIIREVALLRERYDDLPTDISSIYWGGGTPSLLGSKSISKIHHALDSSFSIPWNTIEVTAEANPQDITANKAQELSLVGINRVSLGSQSFNSKILDVLGRDHSGADIKTAVLYLQEANVPNISLDLIFGIPGQAIADLEKDIEEAVHLRPKHISAYSLTIEKGTPFFQSVSTGTMTPLPDEEVRSQYELLLQELPNRGFQQYEVSNFAQTGFQSIHNSNYWRRASYLGLGAGAHSYLENRGFRWSNIGNPGEYISRIGQNSLPVAWSEELGDDDERSERIMLGLRTTHGIPISDLLELKEKREALILEGLAEISGSHFRLTQDGFCIADSIIEDLIASGTKTKET
ncbi:MAG: radical SAM family heme chaperone HemW [Bdellovibrionales bacterium]|nr:radical SAM family heme chaperone HemW [Bdellovibrionales bacterium]